MKNGSRKGLIGTLDPQDTYQNTQTKYILKEWTVTYFQAKFQHLWSNILCFTALDKEKAKII